MLASPQATTGRAPLRTSASSRGRQRTTTLQEEEEQETYAVAQVNFVDALRGKVEEHTVCKDEEGEWLNHDNNWRQCRWLDIDGEISSEAKKRLNCGRTQCGFKCRKTCGCGDNASFERTAKCEDKKGLWQTHEDDGIGRTCDWMDRKDGAERREKNCKQTEIGVMCECKCESPSLVDSTLQEEENEKTSETRVHATFIDALEEEANETCKDKDGHWLNHEGKRRLCRWLNLDNAVAKKRLNCGKTGKTLLLLTVLLTVHFILEETHFS